MAVAFVRELGSAAGSAANGATLTLTTTGSVAAGNCIVVYAGGRGGTGFDSVADSVGNSYVKYGAAANGTTNNAAVWVALNVTALPSGGTITITDNGETEIQGGFTAAEFSGVAAASAVDTDSIGTAVGTSSPRTVSTPLAITQADSVLLGTLGMSGTGTVTAVGSGWTQLTSAIASSTAFLGGVHPQYRVVSTASTYAADWTSAATTAWSASIVALKGAVVTVPTTKYRPATVVSNAGGWAASTGTLPEALDETSASDTDFIHSSTSPASAVVELGLGDVGTRTLRTDHILRWRRRGTGDKLDLTTTLWRGGVQVAGPWSVSNLGGTFTTVVQTLTSTEAAALDAQTGIASIRWTANQNGTLSSGGSQTLAPNAFTGSSGFAASTPTAAQLASQDTDWAVASGNTSATVLAAQFPTPTANTPLSTTANAQSVTLQARKFNTNTGNPTVTVEAVSGGTVVATLAGNVSVSSTSGVVLGPYTWTAPANTLAGTVTIRATTTIGGTGGNRNTLDFGFLSWTAVTAAETAGRVEVSWAEFEAPEATGGGGGDTAVTVAGVTQSHAVTGATVEQNSAATADGTTQVHTVSGLTVGQDSAMTLAGLEQAHTVSGATVTQDSAAVLASSAQDHTVTAVTVAQDAPVTVAGTEQTHTVSGVAVLTTPDAPVLSVEYEAFGDPTLDGTTQSHAVSAMTVAQTHAVVGGDVQQTHTVSGVAVTQDSAVTVAGSTHAHTVSAATVGQDSPVTVAGSTQTHTSTAMTVAQQHAVVLADNTQAHELSALAVAQSTQVLLGGVTQTHTVGQVAVTLPQPASPWDRVPRTSTPIPLLVGTSTAITASVGASTPVPVAVGASTAVAQAAGDSTPVTQPDGVSTPIPAAVGTSTATLVPAGTSTPNTTTPEA